MKKTLLVVLCFFVALPVHAQLVRVQSIDTTIPLNIVDETAATPESGYDTTLLTQELWQPNQNETVDHQLNSRMSNGTFGDATGWTLGGTWAVSGGTLNAVNETGTVASFDVACVQNLTYQITYTITAYTDSTITVSLGGTAGAARSSMATFTESIICGATGILAFTGGTAATASIDNVIYNQAPLSFSPTALGGGVRDMVGYGALGGYYQELTAEDLPVQGTYTLLTYDAGEVLIGRTLIDVVGAASYAVNFSGSAATTAAVADAILEELVADHTGVAGSLAAVINNTDSRQLAYAQLALRSDAAIASDLVTELGEINADEGGGAGTYDNTTEGTQALRDHIADGTNLTEAGGTGDQLTAIDLPNQTMDITGNLSGSVGSLTGHTVQTGDSFARLGAPVGASISADVQTLYTVQADTAFPWFFGPFRSTTNGITKATASDGAPTCTRSINGGAWAAADNAEGTIDAEGWSSLTLSATETGATSTLRVSCELTGFIDQDAIFHIQR